MTTLWADVYDASGARLGEGPVALADASVTRVLDGVGSISLSVPGTDARAVSLLQNEARVRIYYRASDDGPTRELGRGVVRRLRASGATSDFSIIGDGPDDLDALTRKSTLLGRTYSAKTVSQIATGLVGLVSGWTASASGGNTTDARFDGLSVFKALLALAEQQGLHVRGGDDAQEVEVGAFGTSSGLRLVNADRLMHAAYASDEVALVEDIRVEKDSAAVCTRLYPIGAGIGEAWVTLQHATRSSPYTVQSTVGPDGSTQYYLEDAAGVSAFGVIEKVGRFANIAPLSNSAADLENAANALYDIAAAWLTRYSQRQDVYTATARKVRSLVRPGDLVRLVYRGVVTRDGEVVNYLDIDADLWVMEATERVGVEGAALDVTLSTVDRHALDTASIVIGALEELQIDGVSVKPYFNRTNWVYARLIDPLFYATVPVEIDYATQRLNSCKVTFVTGPFISTSLSQLVGAAHEHPIFFGDAENPDAPFTWQSLGVWNPNLEEYVYMLALVSVDMDNYTLATEPIDDPDFFTVAYGLQADDQTPTGISIFIDGVDCTTALGGPWAPSGGPVEVTLDITEYILDNPPLQQEHSIQLRCTTGQGEVEFRVQVYETIQSIRVF